MAATSSIPRNSACAFEAFLHAGAFFGGRFGRCRGPLAQRLRQAGRVTADELAIERCSQQAARHADGVEDRALLERL